MGRELLPPNMDEENLDPFPTDPSKDHIGQHGIRVHDTKYEKPKAKEHGQKACSEACDSMYAKDKY